MSSGKRKQPEDHNSSPAKFHSSKSLTKNTYTKYQHEWTIENFTEFEAGMKDESRYSLCFPLDDEPGIHWQLKFCKRKTDDDDNVDYFSLFLKYAPVQYQDAVRAIATFYIAGGNGERIRELSLSENRSFGIGMECYQRWGFSKFISRETLFTSLPNARLTIGCEVSVVSESTTGSNLDTDYVSSKRKTCTLDYDLESTLLQNHQSDVLIKVGNEGIQAHKLILSARSKVFSAMLEHDMLEKQQQSIEIEDADPAVMWEFISFLYTDKTTKLKQYAYELFILADKYDVANLKILAEEELVNNLNVHNAVQVLVLADMQNNVEMQDATVKFIVGNFDAIPKDEEWHNLKKNHQDMFEKIMFVSFERETV